MSLTKNDLFLIKEILKPEFDRIHEKLIEHDAKFAGIDSKFEEINRKFEGIDLRFEEIDANFERIYRKFDAQNDHMLHGFKEIIKEVYGDLYNVERKIEDHESRIIRLEA